jgi:hypothetical protein
MELHVKKIDLAPRVLVCIECQAVSDEQAKGWKAYLGGGFDGDDIEVGVFCPKCAEIEFQ